MASANVSNSSQTSDGHVPEIGDVSYEIETSVPTDLTISSVSDDEKKRQRGRQLAQYHLRQHRQLLHELQLLKVEVSQKDLLITNLKCDLNKKVEDLEEKLKEEIRNKRLTQARLEAQLKLAEDEATRNQNLMKNEIKSLVEKQAELLKRNDNLERVPERIMQQLQNVEFSATHYFELRQKNKDLLDLGDYIILKIYEYAWNYKKENEELNLVLCTVRNEAEYVQQTLLKSQKELDEERSRHVVTQEKCEKLAEELRMLKSSIQHGNYAQENFDRVKSERDTLNSELLEVREKCNSLKTGILQVTQEKDDAKEEIMLLKHSQALLMQEREHLSRQVGDLTQRWGEAQDTALRLKAELNKAQTSREELLERFVNSRDKYRTEYETRFQEEKEKVKASTASFYEKEIRSLMEAKNSISRKKDVLEGAAEELRKKNEQLYIEFLQKVEGERSRVNYLQKELQEKGLELQKCVASLNKCQEVLNSKEVENEKMATKIEMLQQELSSLKTSTFERIKRLETELGEKTARLEMFTKLEDELNEVVTDAAQVDDARAEQVVRSFTDQLPTPTSMKFAFFQCINLTRKVLKLESDITVLQNKLEEEREKNRRLSEELSKANNLLDHTEQPYSYLVSTIRKSDAELQNVKVKLMQLEKELAEVLTEKRALFDERNRLAADLERLISNREEITKMKQLIETICSNQNGTMLVTATVEDSSKNTVQKGS